ncbi:MAG: hypothetical protein M0Z40_15435 [Actinomycetota bacterium]|nr:hypothetical protein [Actinomycetota bacterium]
MSDLQLSRQEVVAVLRKAGLHELADEAARTLPDPVDLSDAAAWGARHGLSRDDLVNRMGGSP